MEDFKQRLSQQHLRDDLTLYELAGHFAECSLDQTCSRFMQQRLEEATEDEKQILFKEIVGSKCLLSGE